MVITHLWWLTQSMRRTQLAEYSIARRALESLYRPQLAAPPQPPVERPEKNIINGL